MISSPGAERAFKYVWQLDKHIGRTLEILFNDDTMMVGRLLEVDDDTGTVKIQLAPDGKKKADPVEIELKFENIKEAKVKISFSKK